VKQLVRYRRSRAKALVRLAADPHGVTLPKGFNARQDHLMVTVRSVHVE
jgi:hypothetical protein